ncbi:cell shape determination protein CcmA [Solitalea longa]|uniref:Cell shape determination protein CcmA n=1 Tax=Solitalea longa TaxID=2079460 RepID=A0A2S4ZXN2_9SPHI|nr:polymer-forming cytoskeletal protein [Solitalea longa]POY35075.1 cell shape determination protein CcmA [Solitalea longa]
MFKKDKSQETEEAYGSINLIGAGTNITGDIVSKGDIRIDGSVKGNVTSSAKVVLGTSGSVEGSIVCANADVSGALQGDIKVSELLFLKSTTRLNGDIYTNKMVVESGAVFTGKCNMGAQTKLLINSEEYGKTNGRKAESAVA